MLRKLLSQRIGAFVPAENHRHLLPADIKFTHDPYEVSVIDQVSTSDIKAYMARTFYREAPIPVALKLARDCEKTRQFLDKELNLLLNSGVSFQFVDKRSQSVVGIGLSCAWNRCQKYDVVGASLKEWHNTAARIAREEFKEDERHLVWRDLQWQHIYDLGQRLLSHSKRPHVFYFAMLYLDSPLRATKIADNSLTVEKPDCTLLCQSNFRGFDKTVSRVFKKPFVCDEVKYSDEELVLYEKEGRAFRCIDHLDGIRFFANY